MLFDVFKYIPFTALQETVTVSASDVVIVAIELDIFSL